MTPTEFITALHTLNLGNTAAAKVLGVDPRTCRRWASGEIVPVPGPVVRLLAMYERYGLPECARKER